MSCKIGRSIASLCVVALLPYVSAAALSQAADSPAYSIACRVDLDRDPALTDQLATTVTHQIRKTFDAVLSADHTLRFLGNDAALPTGSLDSATLDTVAGSWTSGDRLLLVHVGRDQSWYVVEAREFDPQFQVLGPVAQAKTMQRDLVPSLVSRVVLQAFSPVAQVTAATGTHVRVEFRAGSRFEAYREWLGLVDNVGLQILRESVGRDGSDASRATRFRRTFLAVRKWQGGVAECDLIGPDTDLFAHLNSGSARYVVRPISGQPGPVRVQVVRKDSRQPHEGCEVFVSPDQYSTEPNRLRGLTDRDGIVRLHPETRGIQFVAVRYEGLVLKAPLLPGASSDPLLFELPTRGRRADYVRPLRQLVQEIEDQYLVDTRLREELKNRAEAKEVAEVRRLIERGRQQRISLEEVESRVREIELRARTDGEDVSVFAADVRDFASKRLGGSIDQVLTAYTRWSDEFDKSQTIENLRGRIKTLTEQMEWESLVPVYEELVAVEPGETSYADQLRKLRRALEIKSPEHRDARSLVESGLSGVSTRDLGGRWPEIDRAAHTLLAAQDHLTLLKLRRLMNGWARDMAADAKGLVDQLQAAGQDEEQVQQLRTRLDRLDSVNQSLTKLHKEIQDFLQKLNL